jgi:hypothetical protein
MTIPKLYTSHFQVKGPPFILSGDNHLIVPFSESSRVSLDFRFMSSFNCDKPKSQMLMLPVSFTKTLAA